MTSTTLKRLGAATILLATATLVSRVVGYLREMAVAAWFGAGGPSDAFYAAFTLPDWLNYLAAGGTLSITFLPVYRRYLSEHDDAEANRVLSYCGTLLFLVVAAATVLLELLAPTLVKLVFHRFEPEVMDLCIRYTRILLAAQPAFFAQGLFAATLLARGRFAAAAFSPIVYTLGILAGGALGGTRFGPEGLCWGALAGAWLGPCLITAIAAIRAGMRMRFALSLRHAGFREWLKLSWPLAVGVSLVTVDEWLLRYFAGDVEGGITHLQLARRLVLVPIAVAGQAVGQASLPFFSLLHVEGRFDELADTFTRTLRATLVITIAGAAWMASLAPSLVDLVYRRGAFTWSDVEHTATYLAIFSLAIPLWSAQAIMARLFYGARNTLTPMIAGTVVTLFALPIYVLLYERRGLEGLPWATVVGITLHSLAILVLLPRLLPAVKPYLTTLWSPVWRSALLCGSLAFGTAQLARLVVSPGPLPTQVESATICAVATACYGALAALLGRYVGLHELGALPKRLVQRFRKR